MWRSALAAALTGGIVLLAGTVPPAAASEWMVGSVGGAGQGRSESAPPAPGQPSVSCGLSLAGTITSNWSPVARATSYTVYQSSVSATGPFTPIGSTTATTLTTGALPAATYWFTVRTRTGSNWISVDSPAGSRSITAALLCI